MANTYTWKVAELECVPQVGNKQNVVAVVHWLCVAESDQKKREKNDYGYEYEVITQAKYSGATNVDLVDGAFTPFENLTEQQIVEWVQTILGAEPVAQIYQVLDAEINAKLNPPMVKPKLPWE